MNIFNITFGSADQAIIIDKLKNKGYEVIQTSSGLLAKTDSNLDEIKKTLEDEASQVAISVLDRKDPTLSKDARVFAGIE